MNIGKSSKKAGGLLAVAVSAASCDVERSGVGETAVEHAPITTSTFVDATASPADVQIKVCTSDAAFAPAVDCTVDYGYALVGGGAYAHYTGSGAYVTRSLPVDNMTWRASSKSPSSTDSHQVTAYAVGLRLRGVNANQLRWALTLIPATSSISSNPSVTITPGYILPSAGVDATVGGGNLFVTRTYPDPIGGGSWRVDATDRGASAPGKVGVWAVTMAGTGIVEGFGALQIQHKSGPSNSVGSGVGSSQASVDSGWAVAAYGARATTASGSGRMLTRLGMVTGDVRQVLARSKDHGSSSSSGSTQVFFTQVRKWPGSHGLCNPGSALSTAMDTCVASICASDPYCCTTMWDPVCVSEVTSICGKSCASASCGSTSYQPSYWTQATVQHWNNCYNYATNVRTDTVAAPGRSSGEQCPLPSSDVPPGSQTPGNGLCTHAQLAEKVINDGLIPVTPTEACPDGRSRVAMFTESPPPDYYLGFHFYRQDGNGYWSHKDAQSAPTNRDDNGNLISDPRNAVSARFPHFVGFYCACSSATEGSGHSFIQ